MSKITDLYDYFLNCPQCQDLLPITGEATRGKEIFFPRGSSPIYATQNENLDVLGNYNSTFSPYPSLYEDWQMNLYRYADPNDETQDKTNINIENYEDVEKICNWILQNNTNRYLPKYNGEKVVAIVPTGTMPNIWDADETKQMITYVITIRVYFVNPNPRIEVEYECED